MSRSSIVRAVLMVAGLGALAGAIVAPILVSAVMLAERDVPPMSSLFSLEFLSFFSLVALAGGVAGAVAAPVLGFGLLRRVQLGYAAFGIGASAVIGAFTAEFIKPWNPYQQRIPSAFTGILIGVASATIALALNARRGRTPKSATLQ